jgi:hypothetical protein
MAGARDILASESELLKQLGSIISDFAKKFESDQFENQNLRCWGEELLGYREVDILYQEISDDEKLRAALAEEVQVLNQCLNAIQSDSAAAKYWKGMLRKNIWYTEQTLNRVGT